jgi:hypothetical protein
MRMLRWWISHRRMVIFSCITIYIQAYAHILAKTGFVAQIYYNRGLSPLSTVPLGMFPGILARFIR